MCFDVASAQRIFGRPWVAAVVISVVVLAGCGREKQTSPKGPSGAAPIPVSAERARAVLKPELIAVPGQVRPVHEFVVSSRIQGAIARVTVDSGDRVEAGDLLVELRSAELSARVRRAEVELEAATLELNRVAGLAGSNAATAQELEVAEARHRAAQAALEEAEIFESYAAVRAPFPGTVIRRRAEPGDLVLPGQPLLELQSAAGYRLEAGIPESLAGTVALNETIAFALDHPEITGEAVVSEIEPAADPVTRTVLVKADLPAGASVHAGQFGRLLVPGEKARSITLPETSVVQRGQLEYVFVVSESRAHLRLVRTGGLSKGSIEILAGLDDGEAVIVEPPDGLRDGAAVETKISGTQ